MGYFIAGFAAGFGVTILGLAALAAAVNRAPSKRTTTRNRIELGEIHFDGTEVTRFLDGTGRNGGQL